MNPSLSLNQPPLKCPKCGVVLLDVPGIGARLICEACAVSICPPKPPARAQRGTTADPGMCQICHRDGALLREIGHHPDCKAVQNASVKPYTALPATSKAGGRVQHHARQMNSLESRYAIELEALRLAGEIQWWRFEAIRLRLADKTYYNPDFAVMVAGRLEFRETKGHWEDDSRAKIKIAAELFPCFRFVAVRRVKGQWETEEWNDK